MAINKGGLGLIEITIFKDKRKDAHDSEILKTIVGLARTAFAKDGVFPRLPEEQVKIIMIRKKHYGRSAEMRILIDRKSKLALEEETKLRRFFENSNKGANFPVQIDEVHQDYLFQF